jgi:hypothetical protein
VSFRLTHPVLASAVSTVALALLCAALCDAQSMTVPKVVEAGSAFSIQTSGSGSGVLYIIGPDQVLKQTVQLGTTATFAAGALYNAGHYLAVLGGGSEAATAALDVSPAAEVSKLSFLARPSRLQVSLRDGITGAAYVFDVYRNLVTKPEPVSFELSSPSGASQKHDVLTRNGAAWTAMDSTAQQGSDKFIARIGDVSTTRIVAQVPGDPCSLKMSARPDGQQLQLVTEPVRDCNGNAVPDGTIVTFTENFHGGQSTVDVPLKRGIAEAQLPIHTGSTITVASGVVMGNQIGWAK